MGRYTATVRWACDRSADDFRAQRYSRAHTLHFDGGATVPASSSPQVVKLPWSDASAVDPEEMFVASLASCHMLWFLSLAAEAGYAVQGYDDEADGLMARNAAGQRVMTVVTLRPAVVFVGDRQPDEAALHALHERAHAECFIANSVKSDVRCEPREPRPVLAA